MILAALEPASQREFMRAMAELGETGERPASAVLEALVRAASIRPGGRLPPD